MGQELDRQLIPGTRPESRLGQISFRIASLCGWLINGTNYLQALRSSDQVGSFWRCTEK
jgi:hypothetical protein